MVKAMSERTQVDLEVKDDVPRDGYPCDTVPYLNKNNVKSKMKKKKTITTFVSLGKYDLISKICS